VEQFAGISGQAENWPLLPDGILPPMDLNCVKNQLKIVLKSTTIKAASQLLGVLLI
jgi:hypothetical protein